MLRPSRVVVPTSKLLAVALLLSLAACADDLPRGTAMPVGSLTQPPFGFVDFCRREPTACEEPAGFVAASEQLMPLTQKHWRELTEINHTVNHTVRPETDLEQYHVAEYWTYPHGAGDCEDYALEKRRELLEKGWPMGALLMATARNEHNEMHAVLIVTTDHGDLVLDNATDRIAPWNERPYRWVERESAEAPFLWRRAGHNALISTTTAALQAQ